MAPAGQSARWAAHSLGRPLARPFGVRQRVVGMIGSIRRGVELMQRVDDEAAVAQDLDPLAVAAVELDPASRRCQAVCPALRVEQFLAGGPARSRGAHGDQEVAVRNTSFPPGRSSLAASGTQRAGSHHKLAPHSEMARSKLPGSGTSAASASMSGKVMPDRSWQRRADSSWADLPRPGRPGTAPGQPGGEVRRPAAELDDIKAADVAEHAELLLGHVEDAQVMSSAPQAR